MDRLPLSVAIHPDEYLPGAMARATAFNGHTKLATILGMADVAAMPFSVVGKDPAIANDIAHVLGVAPELISPLWMNEVSDDWVNFFGTSIRKQHRLAKPRRVAPRTLAEGTPYVRAMWQLKPISFDVETLEQLLSKCPVCQRELEYLRTFGVCFCEHCAGPDEFGLLEGKVDLRDFPQQILTVGDREGLDFVTGLINPDPIHRARSAPVLHDDLTVLSRGELFETALALACVESGDYRRVATTIGRPATSEEYSATYSPDAIAGAGRLILNWPNGFYDLCDKMRASASERGIRGAKVELGPVGALQSDTTISLAARQIFTKAISASKASFGNGKKGQPLGMRRLDGLISQKDAIKKYGLPALGLKRLQKAGALKVFPTGIQFPPELLSEPEVAALADRTAGALDLSAVTVRLGLPKAAIHALERASVLTLETGLTAFPTERVSYTRPSVELFENRLMEIARGNINKPPRVVKLLSAIGTLSGVSQPWAEIVRAVMKRKVTIFEIGSDRLPLFERLGTSSDTTFTDLVVIDRTLRDPSEKITVPEAALILGASPDETRDLIALGKLPPGGSLTRADAEDAASTYMFVREIQKRLETLTIRSVAPTLANLGVHPLFVLRRRGRCVFSRAEVEAAIQSKDVIVGD